jgi:hypothetical protein
VAYAIQHFTENGAVAQLGERELCKLEVIGSIPFSSTSLRSSEGCPAKPAGRRRTGDDAHTSKHQASKHQEVRSEGTCFVFFLFCLLMKQKLTL